MSEQATADTQGATHPGVDEPQRPHAHPELRRGSTIGRYVVLHELGKGGMGVVVAAYDPELDRKLAIKLLHEGGSQLRLLAEAQALARLHDPNVVTVHDVGTHDGRVFVAMELVEGVTLATWLARARPPWTRVLEVMIPAGRGLAAAHARDLVHRDFKPDNVMIGDDGRVRVMDFGLVRAHEDSTGAWSEGWPRERALGRSLTRHGALVGTPAYMAPELLARRPGGPAADQFAFCVSLWEALYGRLPFVGQTMLELQARIVAGMIEAPPAGVRVPRWLRRAVERGLSLDHERRWPSMQALLHALAGGRARARWRTRAIALATVGTLGLGAWSWQQLSARAGARACEAEGASLEAVWNDDVAAATAAALGRTGVVHAETTATKVRPWLDAYAREWQHARTETCLAAGTWDGEALERARWCLDERRMELEALLGELGTGEPRTADAAVPAVAALPQLAPCVDPERLTRLSALPAGEHSEVRAIRSALSRATAMRRTGAHERGLEVARAALADAEALGWPPLTAAARIEVAAATVETGAYAQAEGLLVTAYFEAAQAGADEQALDAAGQLSSVVGVKLARHRHGLRWVRHEEAIASRLPDPAGLRQAAYLAHRAGIHRAAGELAEALALHEHVLELRTQALGPRHIEVAQALVNLAAAHQGVGEQLRARAQLEQALEILQDVLGPDHPDVARTLNNLANTHLATGSLDRALALHERARDVKERMLGRDHPDVAMALHNLGAVRLERGENREAMALFQHAVAIYERALGHDHPEVAASLNNLAEAATRLGLPLAAQRLLERALSIQEARLGPAHPDLQVSLRSLAELSFHLGALARAERLYERLLAAEAPDPSMPGRGITMARLIEVVRAQGRREDAAALAERARQRFAAQGETAALAELERRLGS